MAITAEVVRQLRERTGAGMMDCKKALVETDGDIEKAVDFLREKGLAAAAKKAGRIAAEGLVYAKISQDNKEGVLLELNCETDFVAKVDGFKELIDNIATHLLAKKPATLEDALNQAYCNDESKTIAQLVTEGIAKIGENVSLRRFTVYTAQEGAVEAYIHGGGRIGVMMELKAAEASEKIVAVAKDLAMQVAAANPTYVRREDVSEDIIEREKNILRAQALNEGKPANIVEKMIGGRLEKFYKENCLIEQVYIKDNDKSVTKYLSEVSKEVGYDIAVVSFVRYQLGEGIEKKVDNFVDEVMAAAGK